MDGRPCVSTTAHRRTPDSLETYGAVGEGQIVQAGTTLGTVGDSGNARGTPPHLHYGIYRFMGGATNPYPRLAPH